MTRRNSCWLGFFVAVVFCRAAAAGEGDYHEVSTFIVDCDATRQGTGFIAADSSNPGSAVLITALHVIWQCGSIAIKQSNAPFGPPLWTFRRTANGSPGEHITAWYEYDVATIAVPDFVKKNIGPSFQQGVLQADDRFKLPRPYTLLAVLGVTEDNPNPRGVGTLLYDDTAIQTMTFVAGRLGMELALAMGSLNRGVHLLHYFGTGAPGGSGGPVTIPGSLNILAMHEGGNADRNSSWGIRLTGLRSSPKAEFYFGEKWPSQYREPIKGHSADTLPNPPQVEDSVRRAQWHFFWGIESSFETPVTQPTSSVPTMWLNGFIAPDLANKLGPYQDRALALRLATGPLFGPLQQTLSGPDGTPLERSEIWSESGKNWLFELIAQVRFRRFSVVRPSFDFPGIRAGWIEFRDPRNHEFLKPVVGIPIRGRISFSLSRFNAITVEGLMSAEWRPQAVYEYDAVGGAYSGPGTQWSLNVGFGVGYEH